MTTTTLDRLPLLDLPMAKEREKIKRKSRYGFLWVTSGLFLISFIGHWAFAWPVFVFQGTRRDLSEELGKGRRGFGSDASPRDWQ